MANRPLFSVLMANYNNSEYLKEAVDSVLWQEYEDWEIILIDDSSNDCSWDLIRELPGSDRRIRVFRNESNLGIGATKRKCADLARGEICGILDPDDRITPDALNVMVAAHQEHDDCGLISSNYYLCDENLNIEKAEQITSKTPPFKSYLAGNPGDICCFWTFKKSFYNKTEGFSEKLSLAEDQDLFYKLEEVGNYCIIDKILYYYRIHPCSVSRNERLALAFSFHIEVMEQALRRRKKKSIIENRRLEIQKVCECILHFLSWGIGRVEKKRLLRECMILLKYRPNYLFKKNVLRFFYWYIRYGK